MGSNSPFSCSEKNLDTSLTACYLSHSSPNPSGNPSKAIQNAALLSYLQQAPGWARLHSLLPRLLQGLLNLTLFFHLCLLCLCSTRSQRNPQCMPLLCFKPSMASHPIPCKTQSDQNIVSYQSTCKPAWALPAAPS